MLSPTGTQNLSSSIRSPSGKDLEPTAAQPCSACQPDRGITGDLPCGIRRAVRQRVAYLLGSFNEFHQLGSFQRLTLSWRIFGRDHVTIEIARVRTVLGTWGYQLGQADDTLLPSVACQLFLLNRSPQLEDMGTALFDRVRRERLLEVSQLNTLTLYPSRASGRGCGGR